jgi:Mrp family chromosome partitioning ATPase
MNVKHGNEENINQEKDAYGEDSLRDEGKNISSSLVRLRKNIIYDEHKGAVIDSAVVNPDFYNAFDCTSVPEILTNEKFALGITSPKSSDGKTLVASNFAVSVAMAQRKETVLVDFNIGRAKVHKVFGVPLGPGLLDALNDNSMHVCRTNVKHLSVLTAGIPSSKSLEAASFTMDYHPVRQRVISLEHLSDFRNLIYSLQKEFDLVIVDLPSIKDSGLPALFARQLDGVIVVVNAGITKKQDLNEVLFHLNTSNVLGFVFNRITKNNIMI